MTYKKFRQVFLVSPTAGSVLSFENFSLIERACEKKMMIRYTGALTNLSTGVVMAFDPRNDRPALLADNSYSAEVDVFNDGLCKTFHYGFVVRMP